MKFFVKNLITKLLLLTIFAAPLTLYAMSEVRHLSKAPVEVKDSGLGGESDAELKKIADEANLRVAVPTDLHKELVFPSGGVPSTTQASAYQDLAKAVAPGADLLAKHRAFLEKCADFKKANPKFDGELKVVYTNVWQVWKEYFEVKANIDDLLEKLRKADPTKFAGLEKELTVAVKRLAELFEKDPYIPMARDELAKLKLQQKHALLEDECKEMDEAFRKVVNKPEAGPLRTTTGQINDLLKKLRDQEREYKKLGDNKNLGWVVNQISDCDNRSRLLPEVRKLLDDAEQSLEPNRVKDYLIGCEAVLKEFPSDSAAERMVGNVVEDFCRAYMDIKRVESFLKYDDVVELTGSNNVKKNFPREQVYVGLKDGTGKYLDKLEENPPKKDAYTEFKAKADTKNFHHFTVYVNGKPVDDNYKDRPERALEPTPLSKAVDLYYTYSRPTRWNASAIRDFHRQCENHQKPLGEAWKRLDALAEAIEKVKILFPRDAK